MRETNILDNLNCKTQAHVRVCKENLIKNNPGVKKGQPRTNTGFAEKDVKSNGRQMPPGFDGLENFDHDELTAKHCYFRCSRPPDVDGIKIFDKDDQAAKH